MWLFRRHEVKKEPMSTEAAEAALERAEAAVQDSTEALERAKTLAAETKPVMEDLRRQRRYNHFALDIYKAMLSDGKQ
jgi:Tfp pilus assembly protein PilX